MLLPRLVRRFGCVHSSIYAGPEERVFHASSPRSSVVSIPPAHDLDAIREQLQTTR